jgi:hypothetical protein
MQKRECATEAAWKRKSLYKNFKKNSVLYLAQLKMIDFTPIYFPYKAKKLWSRTNTVIHESPAINAFTIHKWDMYLKGEALIQQQ